MMEHKLLEPIEVTDAELDVISGGQFVGIQQRNRGANFIVRGGEGGGANVANSSNTAYQSNYNYGNVNNSGAVG